MFLVLIIYIIAGYSKSQGHCSGNGPVHCLNATKDILLERGSTNFNFYKFLIFGKHVFYPKKRILIQFDDIPNNCGNIVWAKLYMKYWYSHKPSWVNATNIHRTVQVHQVIL